MEPGEFGVQSTHVDGQSNHPTKVALVEFYNVTEGRYVCANGGNCTSPGVCECAAGWSGFDCRTPICSQASQINSAMLPSALLPSSAVAAARWQPQQRDLLLSHAPKAHILNGVSLTDDRPPTPGPKKRTPKRTPKRARANLRPKDHKNVREHKKTGKNAQKTILWTHTAKVHRTKPKHFHPSTFSQTLLNQPATLVYCI